jgi:hypothetical protein
MSMTKSIEFNVINASKVGVFDLWLPQEIAHFLCDVIRFRDQGHISGLFTYSLHLLNLFIQYVCFYWFALYIALGLFHESNSQGEK